MKDSAAICKVLRNPIDQHAVALTKDGGPESIKTGATLVRTYDVGCELSQ